MQLSSVKILLLLTSLCAWPAHAVTEDAERLSECQPDAVQSSGAIYRICTPPAWLYNNDLVIWAHGYVYVTEPVGIPEDQLCIGNLCISDVANLLGFGFATTSYSVNGLAVTQGMVDILELVDIYTATQGPPERVFLVGASQGGLITTLLLEQYPEIFASGLAMCGPIGDFVRQLNYFGDARVIFDVFFPELLPGSPQGIPPALLDAWDSYYTDIMEPVVFAPANTRKRLQWINAAGLPYDPNDFTATSATSISDVLRYNALATNDGIAKLGGYPFGNQTRYYTGSANDTLLNQVVRRYAADPAAIAEIEANYQTSGQLTAPLVTLHTTRDQQVPYFHEVLYAQKVQASGSQALYAHIPVDRYGHCNFEASETLAAFALAYLRGSGEPLAMTRLESLLPATERGDFRRLAKKYGLAR